MCLTILWKSGWVGGGGGGSLNLEILRGRGGSKFKFQFGSTCAAEILGAQLKILGALLIMLGASISKEKVKSLTVPRLFVIFSLLLLLQSCD